MYFADSDDNDDNDNVNDSEDDDIVQSSLIGEWEFVSMKRISDGSFVEMVEYVEIIEFKSDGTYIKNVNGFTSNGTWIDLEDGNMTLTGNERDGYPFNVDGDTLTMIPNTIHLEGAYIITYHRL